ncbi:MAG: VWA domain-containing protein [Pseudomonadales bacterium]|nr:VWA domain-containing protein [Pseudomonadales bacterium]MDG1443563.1 VWA domain-containing protein [Pseudomonadales bacterium]
MLDLLELMRQRLIFADLGEFYFLSRTVLVKDEQFYDRFDRAFADFFDGIDALENIFAQAHSPDLLNSILVRYFPNLNDDQYRQIIDAYQSAIVPEIAVTLSDAQQDDFVKPLLGQADLQLSDGPQSAEGSQPAEGSDSAEGSPKNSEANAMTVDETGDDGKGQRDLEEQGEEEGQGEGQGEGEGEGEDEGNGAQGKLGLGAGEKPGQGIRDDSDIARLQTATKVWLQRQYEDVDPDAELGTRNLKMALRRLRKFARTGADLELDLEDTIRRTAKNAGMLDIVEVPEKRNAVKVLLFLDVGGSMDEHVLLCSQLFSAARSEFKYLEIYYFHNFPYEFVWTGNDLGKQGQLNTYDLINRFGRDYKVIFVGDANMARHEITDKGGSVEHFNAEPGEVWFRRIQDHFKKVVWLNPVALEQWQDSHTTVLIQRLINDHMYHLGVKGIERAMKQLGR